ncbi:MAG: alanine--tRNA ligase, partial [Candidatus Omnitrophica bacterium]|nr:alanine--tRNA ligase [Candidatus Omnitrophota bacterium]
IDTGMGLERLTRVVMQHETGRADVTDYDTDLFKPIVDEIVELARRSRRDIHNNHVAVRTIADHVRAITFLIAEGVLPSNESRGYVLRMLIRRAYRFGRKIINLDFEEFNPGTTSFLAQLAELLVSMMEGTPYGDRLHEKEGVISRVIEEEESRFAITLEAGTEKLAELIKTVRARNHSTISGTEAFKLYDTYGFPLELTVEIAQEQGVTVERSGFEAALKTQQERSRAASQFGGAVFTPTTLTLKNVPRSEFVGYDTLQTDTVVKGIWKQDGWVQSAREGDEVGVVLERSPFYGESGGQVGDRGTIEAPKGRLDVLETQWADELLVHQAKVRQGTVSVNEPVRAGVDAARRLQIARSHTATHLLHWALRKVLGPETVQAGSLVEAERVRFDFSALGGLKDEQRMKVEQLVNSRILAEDRVQTDLMNVEDAKRAGALALFGEKYHSQVRVVSIGDYSKELCGGTHLRHTGSVGAFQIVAESSIAAGTRRIEAMVGESALARRQQDAQVLRAVAEQLGRSPQDVLQGIEDMAEQVKAAERQLKNLKIEFARLQARQFVAEAKRINGVALVTARVDGADRELLAAMADAIRGALTDGVALLVSVEQPSTVAWVMALTATLVKRGLHAGRLLKPIAAITQGGGGGRPEFAQAGGKDPSRIPEALTQAEQLLREALA